MTTEQTSWPRRFPMCAFLGVLVAIGIGTGLIKLWMRNNPEKAFYLPAYVKTSIYAGKSDKPFAVRGTDGVVTTEMYPADGFHEWLRVKVFEEKPLTELFRYQIWAVGGLACLGICIGIIYDRRYAQELRKGRFIRGRRLVTRWQFNRKVKGVGLGIRTTTPPSYREKVMGDSTRVLRIPLNREAHHVQIFGDTGSGKSTIIRDFLYQIEARGDVAIVFDPDQEFTVEFADEKRGDWILNVKDERCPYWDLGNEPVDLAEAVAIMDSMITDSSTVNGHDWFARHARAIGTYIIATYRPTIGELVAWLADPKELDERLKGTELAGTLSDVAGGQRQAILGTLNEIGQALRLLPQERGTRRVYTASEWAKKREGWIFITGTAGTQAAVRPLQTAWLDMLILKLQTTTEHSGRRVWLILDELAGLKHLPQLHQALTRQRKFDSPIILGFQGMAQIEARYGKEARTILSQAFTNIVLRTNEPEAAKYVSELVGEQELERIKEQRSKGVSSYSTEQVRVPLLMASEIQIMDDLNGYLVLLGMIVKFTFEPLPKRWRTEGFIERMIPTVDHRNKPSAVLTGAIPSLKPWRGSGRAAKTMELWVAK